LNLTVEEEYILLDRVHKKFEKKHTLTFELSISPKVELMRKSLYKKERDLGDYHISLDIKRMKQ